MDTEARVDRGISPKGETGQANFSKRAKRTKTIARLTFYYCGRGDTILIQGGRNLWGLVDCNLTKASGCDDRIRSTIRKHRVNRLAFACLTHPDIDHYRGMQKLLSENFVNHQTGSARLDEFWDCGVDIELLYALVLKLRKHRLKRDLYALYDLIGPNVANGRIKLIQARSDRMMCEDFAGFQIVSLAPEDVRVRRFARKMTARLLDVDLSDSFDISEDCNNISSILVLMHKTLPVNIILGGDASTKVWDKALASYDRICKAFKRTSASYAAVKVSHHGARNSLCYRLYESYCTAGETVGILSVGPNDTMHPHPRVLDALRAHGIKVYATCWPSQKKKGCQRVRTALPLPGKRRETLHRRADTHAWNWADIQVIVSVNGNVSVIPEESCKHHS